MTSRQKNRAVFIIGGFIALWVAVFLFVPALEKGVVFSYGPTDIIEKKIKPGQNIRLSGLVVEGSLKQEEGLRIKFSVSDGNKAIPVTYTGSRPDLFGEKQGVIAEGQIDENGVFQAETILAKHDENYMPREVVDALKKQGVWRNGKVEMPKKPQPQPQPQTDVKAQPQQQSQAQPQPQPEKTVSQ
jgi:cytochrome c-type biogenesis protein CcmE